MASAKVDSSKSMVDKSSLQLLDNVQSPSDAYSTVAVPMHFTQMYQANKGREMPSPATYTKPRRRRCGFAGSSCCCAISVALCSTLVTLVVLLGLATLITWLVLRPIHAPDFSLNDLQIKALSVSPQNTLNANMVYTFTANNRNKKLGFKYDVIDMDTSYGGHVFGHSSIPAFSQGHRVSTILASELVVSNYAFVPASLGSALAAEVQRGSVALHGRGSAKVRVKVGAITGFAVRVQLNCDFTVRPPTATSPGSVIAKTCKLTR